MYTTKDSYRNMLNMRLLFPFSNFPTPTSEKNGSLKRKMALEKVGKKSSHTGAKDRNRWNNIKRETGKRRREKSCWKRER